MTKWIALPALCGMLACAQGFAASQTPATKPTAAAAAAGTTLSANDEPTIMKSLGQEGYLDFNSYEHVKDGSAEVQAMNGTTGALDTISVGPKGKVSMVSGWNISQPPKAEKQS